MTRKIMTLLLVAAILLAALAPGTAGVAQAETAATPFQDYGDAPDSTNQRRRRHDRLSRRQRQLPHGGAGVRPARPCPHRQCRRGCATSWAMASAPRKTPTAGADDDGINNIVPQLDMADRDGRDDGVAQPDTLPHCERVQIQVAVTVFDRGQSFPEASISMPGSTSTAAASGASR